MASNPIHIHKAGAMNSQAVCGKVLMSASAQEHRMTYQVHKATCERCLAEIPAKFR